MKFLGFLVIVFLALTGAARAQSSTVAARNFDLKAGGAVEIKNLYGRVSVIAEEAQGEKVSLTIQSAKPIVEKEIKADAADGKIIIAVNPKDGKTRVDLTLKIPTGARVKIETGAGEVRVAGEIQSAEVTTETGTISTDVPLDNLKYNLVWTASRPRYLSEVELEKADEKRGGKFSISGRLGDAATRRRGDGKRF